MRRTLETLYRRYNRPEYVDPDPLALVLRSQTPEDQEVAGLIAASLAFGNVRSILQSASRVLDLFPRPAADLRAASPAALRARLSGFRHRYVAGGEMADFLLGIRNALTKYGTIENCFLAHFHPDHESILPALIGFADALRIPGGPSKNYLLPDPRLGSACKRWFMYLRWMARRDAVDPGPWRRLPPAKLIMPVDTHIHRIALRLGWSRRKTADLRTAFEITDTLRVFSPHDPVRYDFALARLGIRSDTDLEAFIRACAPGPEEQDLAD